ncbi:MAG: amidohydrolase family protein [Clostridiales bacterium]|jgi:predicted TIM-barrel fold metal-dependent hydrolase|nr:amidohydrolase family protein [Clostridiales bacterium]
MIIDFHTHCFPDALAQRALSGLSEKGGIPYLHGGTFAALKEYEGARGCDGFVILPVATNPKQAPAVNRFAAASQDKSRRVYAFGSVHPRQQDFREEIRTIKELGLSGVKLHPEYQEFDADDENIFPVYEEIFRHELPLIFHAGEDIGFTTPLRAAPDKIARVAGRFPRGTIIAAHMGGYPHPAQAAERLPYPNVYADVSFVAGRAPREGFEEACRAWGYSRLLFGSDSPWHDPAAGIAAVNALPCSEAERELIFYKNALKILRV